MVKLVHGVLNLFKPAGMTSHDLVLHLRHLLKTKKIGHAGTLDPQAFGVLPLCVGKATRLVEYLIEWDKVYLGELTLGITTETQDAWGKIVRIRNFTEIPLAEIEEKLQQFTGAIRQIPPAYSAVKIKGIPLYKRARLGLPTEARPRQVFVHQIKIIKYQPPRLIFEISCSKGTYLRTICHDLGEALGVGAHLSFLLRTKVGSFTAQESISLEEVAVKKEKALLPLEVCVQGLNSIILIPAELQKLKSGQPVFLRERLPESANVAVFDQEEKLVAIAEVVFWQERLCLKPKKVLKRE